MGRFYRIIQDQVIEVDSERLERRRRRLHNRQPEDPIWPVFHLREHRELRERRERSQEEHPRRYPSRQSSRAYRQEVISDSDDDDDDDDDPCDDDNDSDSDDSSDDEEEDREKFPWWVLLILALLLLLMLLRLIIFLLGLLLLLLLLLLLILVAGLLVTPALMLVGGDSDNRGVFEKWVMPLMVMVTLVVTAVMVLVMKKRHWYEAIVNAVDTFGYWWERVGSLSKNTLIRFMPKKVGLLEAAQQAQWVMVLVLTSVVLVLVNVVVMAAVLLVGDAFGRTVVLLLVLMAMGVVLMIDVNNVTWYGVARYVVDILRSAARNRDQLRAFQNFFVLHYLLGEVKKMQMDAKRLLSKLAMWLMAVILLMELVVMPILTLAGDLVIHVAFLGTVAGMMVFVKQKELIQENQMEFILKIIDG